jgi:hypothetical protein
MEADAQQAAKSGHSQSCLNAVDCRLTTGPVGARVCV